MTVISKKICAIVFGVIFLVSIGCATISTLANPTEEWCHEHAWSEVYESKQTCNVCGEYFDTATLVSIHILSVHDGNGSYSLKSVLTGYQCSSCGLTNDNPEPAGTDHDWQEEKIEPTCTEDGSIVYTCAYCGDSYTETLDATGHTEADAVVENNVDPTCTEDGSYDSVVYCSVCNEKLSSATVTVPATGHGDLDETDRKNPTCTVDGYVTYKCEVCGETFTETLDATGHTEADPVIENNVDPTCTEDGSYDSVVYCTVCNEKLSSTTVTVPATGHGDLEEIDSKDPTCTENGYVTYKCEVCDETYTETLDATGHTEADAVVENNVDPTCTEAGSYDSVVYCTVCNEKLSSTTVAVPAIGHDFIWVVDQEATETEEGAQHQECSDCGEIGDSEVIPAIGEETADTTEDESEEEDSETDATDSDDATETEDTVDANNATDTSDDDAEDTTTDSADATDTTTDDSTTTTSNDVPATGDESNAIPYAITLILSVVLMSAIIIYTKKRKA